MDVKIILENSDTAKANKHIQSGFPMSTISSFRSKGNKHDMYKGKDCTKKFCEFLRQRAMKTNEFLKK